MRVSNPDRSPLESTADTQAQRQPVGVDRAAEATLERGRGLVVGDEADVARTITVVSDGESDQVRLPSVVVAIPGVRHAVNVEGRIAERTCPAAAWTGR